MLNIVTGINPKALQLTIVLLRQYHPELSVYLPGPQQYPVTGIDVDLELDANAIGHIIEALTDIGQRWLQEKQQRNGDSERDTYRQSCIQFLLQEWTRVGEQYQKRVKSQLH